MTTHNHPIAAEELMAYLDGELASTHVAAAATHLEGCMECQQLAADLRGLSQTVKKWEVSTPKGSDIPKSVASALDANSAERIPVPAIPMPWQMRLRSLFRGWPPALVGSAVLTIVIVSAVHFIGRTANTAFSEVGSAMVSEREVVPPSAVPTSKSRSAPVTLPVPGLASDSNGLFHGFGDHGATSFSADGQPITDQQSRAYNSRVPVPSASPKSFDRLQQFAKLNTPPLAKMQSQESAASTTPMVIRTAGLSLVTKDFDKARAQVEEIIHRHRGYIGTLAVSGAAGTGRTLTGSLRIPSTQLDVTLAELKSLGRLDSESQNGEDITAQYVDLNARLDNARHTEQRLTDLLQNRTGQLSEVLSVENELARVRGEIESMEAQRKSMANQVDFATINLTISEDYRAQLQVVPPSTSTRLSNAAVAGYRNLTDGLMSATLFFLESGPSLLLWAAILFFPARFAWKKLRNRSLDESHA